MLISKFSDSETALLSRGQRLIHFPLRYYQNPNFEEYDFLLQLKKLLHQSINQPINQLLISLSYFLLLNTFSIYPHSNCPKTPYSHIFLTKMQKCNFIIIKLKSIFKAIKSCTAIMWLTVCLQKPTFSIFYQQTKFTTQYESM